MTGNDVEIRVRVRDQTEQGFRDVNGRLRDMRGRFRSEGAAAGRGYGDGLLGPLRGAAGEAGSILKSVFGSVTGLAALGSATGSINGLVAAVTNLAGAALVLPGALSAAAAAAATFQIGTAGVMDALTAKPSGGGGGGGGGGGSSAATAISNAKALRAANDAVANAQRGIVTASKQVEAAQRGVAAAERQVIDAEHAAAAASRAYEAALQAEKRAEEDVTRARADAVRQLEDLAESQADAQRGEEGASIRLKRAQENLIRVQKDVKHTALDLEEAQFQVAEAQNGVSDAQTASQRATEDNTTAQAKGVDGADQVVAAQDALAAAHQQVADAAYASQQAQQGVLDAVQGVADAHDQLAEAQQGVIDAQHQADEAAQNLKETLAQQAIKAQGAAGGVDAYAAALAKLSPNAREFVTTLRALAPAWEAVQRSIQDRMFEGLAGDVKALAKTYLPVLKDGLGGIASEMNGMARYAVKALLDPTAVEHINNILDNTASFLHEASTAVGDLISGFLGLADTGSGFLPDFGKWIADIAREFKTWVTQNPEEIKKFISDGIQGFKDLFEIIGNIKDIFVGLFGGTNEEGKTFLQTVKDVTKWLADIAPTVGEILPVLAALWLTNKAVAFGKAAFGVFKEIGVLADRLGPRIARAFSSRPAKLLGAAAVVALGAVAADAILPDKVEGSVVPGISSQSQRDDLKGIADGIKDPKAALDDLKGEFDSFPANFDQSPFMEFWRGFPDWWNETIWTPVSTFVSDAWTGIGVSLTTAKDNVVAILAPIWDGFTGGLESARQWCVDRWTDIQTAVANAKQWISDTLGPIWDGFINGLSTARQWCVDTWNDIKTNVGAAIDIVKDRLGRMWDGLVSGAKGAANGAISIINGLIRGMNVAIQGLNAINPFGAIGSVPYISYLAKGGIASGMAIVGERGPELVNLPAGSRVHPAGESRRMLGEMAGGGSGVMRVELVVGPGGDQAVATMIMHLQRTGALQLRPAA